MPRDAIPVGEIILRRFPPGLGIISLLYHRKRETSIGETAHVTPFASFGGPTGGTKRALEEPQTGVRIEEVKEEVKVPRKDGDPAESKPP